VNRRSSKQTSGLGKSRRFAWPAREDCNRNRDHECSCILHRSLGGAGTSPGVLRKISRVPASGNFLARHASVIAAGKIRRCLQWQGHK
jgi:hypothetical protein